MVHSWVHCSRSYIRVSEGRIVIWLTCFGKGTLLSYSHILHYTAKVNEILGNIPSSTQIAYPLVDWVVLAAMKPLFEVEYPHSCAGVDVVVVEHTINCYVLPRTHHHFLGDVAHRCKHTRRHTHTPIFLYKSGGKDKKNTSIIGWTNAWKERKLLRDIENFSHHLVWSELRVNHPLTGS